MHRHLDKYPKGWLHLYKTPRGMICLYGKVMTDTILSMCFKQQQIAEMYSSQDPVSWLMRIPLEVEELMEIELIHVVVKFLCPFVGFVQPAHHHGRRTRPCFRALKVAWVLLARFFLMIMPSCMQEVQGIYIISGAKYRLDTYTISTHSITFWRRRR